MLSGYVPFYKHDKQDTANDIMRRIRNAQFDFKAKEWHGVSNDAKDLIRGASCNDFIH